MSLAFSTFSALMLLQVNAEEHFVFLSGASVNLLPLPTWATINQSSDMSPVGGSVAAQEEFRSLQGWELQRKAPHWRSASALEQPAQGQGTASSALVAPQSKDGLEGLENLFQP